MIKYLQNWDEIIINVRNKCSACNYDFATIDDILLLPVSGVAAQATQSESP